MNITQQNKIDGWCTSAANANDKIAGLKKSEADAYMATLNARKNAFEPASWNDIIKARKVYAAELVKLARWYFSFKQARLRSGKITKPKTNYQKAYALCAANGFTAKQKETLIDLLS